MRANCQWVYQKLDSRCRLSAIQAGGNDIALKLFSVMPVQAGIQALLLLGVNANEIRSKSNHTTLRHFTVRLS